MILTKSDKKNLSIKILVLIGQIILGGLFIYAGILKIADPEGFSIDIENYRMAPKIFVNLIAIFLPYLEVITGLLVIFSPKKSGSLLILSALIFFFLIGITQAIIRGLDIECGCFGDASRIVGIRVLAEDLFFLIIALTLFIIELKKQSLKQV